VGTDTLVSAACDRISRDVQRHDPSRAMLVAISGIDASGKGTLALAMERTLSMRGHRVALIGLDPWHHPKAVRFAEHDPGGHFYARAFRFDDLFRELIDPLSAHRSIRTTASLIDLATDGSHVQSFELHDIDIVLLEGIFLFKRAHRDRYDLSIWIECSFEKALERAIARNQEGQSSEELVRDYERIYFAAQRMHFALDEPRAFADMLIENS
jgi:uridine kinase